MKLQCKEGAQWDVYTVVTLLDSEVVETWKDFLML